MDQLSLFVPGPAWLAVPVPCRDLPLSPEMLECVRGGEPGMELSPILLSSGEKRGGYTRWWFWRRGWDDFSSPLRPRWLTATVDACARRGALVRWRAARRRFADGRIVTIWKYTRR